MNRAEYQEYLKSFWWQTVREMMLKDYPNCQRCGFPYEINVHHKTYKRLGHERIPEDLEVLCKSCHSRHHFIENISDIEVLFTGENVQEIKARLTQAIKEAKEKNYQRDVEFRANVRRDKELE